MDNDNSGTGGGSDPDNEEEGENEAYVVPKLCGDHLTIFFPLLVPIPCIIGKCGTKIKNKTWSTSVSNYVRHIADIHKIAINKNKRNWCSICQNDIGRQVAAHACFGERLSFVVSDKKFQFACKYCPENIS